MDQRVQLAILARRDDEIVARVFSTLAMWSFKVISASVAPTHESDELRMTLTVAGRLNRVEHLLRDISSVIGVLTATTLHDSRDVWRESAMVKVRGQRQDERAEAERVCHAFGGKILELTASVVIFVVTGSARRIDRCIRSVGHLKVLEVVRSGPMGMHRDDAWLQLRQLPERAVAQRRMRDRSDDGAIGTATGRTERQMSRPALPDDDKETVDAVRQRPESSTQQ